MIDLYEGILGEFVERSMVAEDYWHAAVQMLDKVERINESNNRCRRARRRRLAAQRNKLDPVRVCEYSKCSNTVGRNARGHLQHYCCPIHKSRAKYERRTRKVH